MPNSLLRQLPAVQDLIGHSSIAPLIQTHGRDVVVRWVRDLLQQARNELLDSSHPSSLTDRAAWLSVLAERIHRRADEATRKRLGRAINATGVVLHTGLGRAPLSRAARQALSELGGHANVEVDLETSERCYRGHQLSDAFRTLTGCEDVLIVNNNAAATLLTLQALCSGREVVISRGQLIEIGGSFRLPEIFTLSGAVLHEVGTTNRTRLSDYRGAISSQTAAVMHVHPSNYRVIGFSETPLIAELVTLAREHHAISIDDIGSGALLDVTQFGLPFEPTFQHSLAAGADVVLGSGDKLLGGPQCGIILGKHEFVERIRQHPLARAVRVGKLTLAALQATLDSYLRNAAVVEIPTLAMLAAQQTELRARAVRIRDEIGAIPTVALDVAGDVAEVGGGSLPGVELTTVVLRLRHRTLSANELAHRLRVNPTRVFSRIHDDAVCLDLRSVLPEDDSRLAAAVRSVAAL